MKRIKRGRIDLDKITDEDLATLASGGDSEAFTLLWERVSPKVSSIVARSVRKQAWLSRQKEDIVQAVLVKYPVWIRRYDPAKLSTTFDKWLHFTIRRVTQDVIRQEKDSLGVSIPQKRPYPEWQYLSEYSASSKNWESGKAESAILDGIERIDRGYRPKLGW
jgi:DNA-directed RNA polymerase specialized sigma24 family protein